MTINEINTTLLLKRYYQSPLSVCNNFWLRSNVDFGQMMRQKYIVSKNFMGIFCGAWKKSNVTSSVINYCCQNVISKVIILLLKGVTSNE